jgi:hypothetical protein
MNTLIPDEKIEKRVKSTLNDVVQYAKYYESKAIDDKIFKKMILEYISGEDDAIPSILQILDFERKRKQDLLNDTNLELSRSLVALISYEKNTKVNLKQKRWIVGEIKKHFKKWSSYIGCCFNVDMNS